MRSVGFGYAVAHASYLSSSRDALAIWPGATALIGLGGAFVGADARYVVILNEDDGNALALFATGGLKF